jgi:hypothetical protein
MHVAAARPAPYICGMTDLEERDIHPGYMLFGVGIIAVGVLFLLDALDLMRLYRFSTYWPVLLILFGLSRIVWPARPGSEIGGSWIALVGGLLLLDRMQIAPMRETWPTFVILAGLLVVFRALGWLPGGCHGRRWRNSPFSGEAGR